MTLRKTADVMIVYIHKNSSKYCRRMVGEYDVIPPHNFGEETMLNSDEAVVLHKNCLVKKKNQMVGSNIR